MTRKTDQGERLVVPMATRDLAKRPSLKRVGHFLVHTGEAPNGFNPLNAITDDREEHLRHQAGF